ncbi:hypothetical protein ILUMI_16619 [Ignelater luminosus]|uniref:Uncharacterized protein n=1 Tax=Ignelater luminosus TaxID=2038154 RepID=A0A8K0CLE7_IGNLU|nr:hypothetical protein ILUMI_16619 [Ignelater luminosus]
MKMKKIEKMFEGIATWLMKINKKLENNTKEMNKLTAVDERLKKKINELEQGEKIKFGEWEIKRENVVIKGIEDREGKAEVETKEKVAKLMETMSVKLKMG